MELKDYGRILWKNLWLILLTVLIIGGGVYYYSIRQAPLYRSEALLLVTTPPPKAGSSYPDILTMERQALTFSEMLRGRTILDAVSPSVNVPALDLSVNLTVSPLQDTQLIQVTYTDTQPTRAQLILNAICDYFSQYIGQLYYLAPDNTITVLQDQVQKTGSDLEAAKKALASMVSSTPSQLQLAQEKVSFLQTSYLDLVGKLNATRQSLAEGVSQVIVYERGNLPISTVAPRVAVNMAIGCLFGLFLGLALTFLRNYLDDTLKTEEDVRKYLKGLPVLGAMPVIARNRRHPQSRARGRKKENETPVLAVMEDPKSAAAEGFRTLRTNLQFLSAATPVRSLVITSPTPGEGKSTIAVNLAASMAQIGQEVILVDADLRRPSLHRVFSMAMSPGLSNYLVGKTDVSAILQETKVPHLRLIASGPLPPLPAELLSSPRMKTLLEDLLTQADTVIVDTPPAVALTDATLLSSLVNGTLMVITCGRTTREQAKAALQVLENAGIRPLGVIMNQVDRRKGYGYYYFYYRRYEKDSQKRRAITMEPLQVFDLPTEMTQPDTEEIVGGKLEQAQAFATADEDMESFVSIDGLRHAERMIQEGRLAEAVGLLRRLLDQPDVSEVSKEEIRQKLASLLVSLRDNRLASNLQSLFQREGER
jgi:succinoglycan biosynthesis transport protein ExoP